MLLAFKSANQHLSRCCPKSMAENTDCFNFALTDGRLMWLMREARISSFPAKFKLI